MLDLLPHSTTKALAILALVSFSAVIAHLLLQFRKRNYPPGPWGDPLIGQLRHLAASPQPEFYYKELNDRYGDVVHISAPGHTIILLGSWEAANQLLGKRGSIYSGRAPTPFSNVTLDLDNLTPIVPYGATLREERRMFGTHLGKEESRVLYRQDIEAEACTYVLDALEKGSNSYRDYELALQKTFINTMYGMKVKSNDDKILQQSLIGTSLGSTALVPGRYLVNIFPWLDYFPAWFPGANWKNEGAYIRKEMADMIHTPFKLVKKAEVEGAAKQSFTLSMLQDKTILDDDALAKTTGAAFTAGGETTLGFVQYFIYAMLMFPDIQKKAQEELDRVVGRDRLPTVADYPDLPYLHALVKEVHRWRPVAPISIPHALAQDDVYRGYFIPKGSIVVQNIWAMCMDESLYKNAAEFNPDRFMVEDPPMDPRLFTFGVGRRICPGRHYADVVYIVAMTTILATVNIVRARDENGNELDVRPGAPGTGGLINTPLPFPYKFTPRSDVAVDLLRFGAEL